jgi:phosphate-selective porin OprO/OprP
VAERKSESQAPVKNCSAVGGYVRGALILTTLVGAFLCTSPGLGTDESAALGTSSIPEKSSGGDGALATITWDKDQITPTWHLTPETSLRLRGRIDTDFIWTKQSPGDIATFGNFGDVVGLRRARIGAEGTLPDGRYIAEIDLATGMVVPKDVFAGFYGDEAKLDERRGGHFREPFSLEGGTSANSFAFLERSPANLLDPGRNWGLGLFHAGSDKSYTLDGGLFHAGTDPSDFQAGPGATAGFTGRLTMAPVDQDKGERLFHIAIALSERIPETGVIVVNQQPRSALLELGDSSSSPFVPKIQIPSRFQQLINLQTAWAEGPFWAGAEWY